MGSSQGKSKELEIIKQLFDVGNLFDEMTDVNTVSQTFKQMAQQELIYRERDEESSYRDVLEDIFETSRILSERGRIEKDIYDQLQLGVNRIKDYIFSRNYIVESAINSASKAAYLSLLIKHEMTDVEKFDPEAYFYWYKSIEILNQKTVEETS